MIDQTSQFFAILTNVGAAKQANADALGIPWKLSEMGVGDANGTDPTPSAAQTSLINEWRRRPLNQLFIDPVNPAVIIAEQVIPADEGGFWIREIGLYDADGDLVAVANCPPSFKPIMSQGSGRTQVVRMNFIVSSTGNITLKIDPSVVLATREFVERRIQEELYKLDNKQSVRVATTANIALTGLQTIDGVSLLAGDRVLVKNQAASKDNGIYIVGVAAWQRAPDADSSAEVTSAMILSVEQGATLADTRWQLVTDGAIVLGTTSLTFQNITQGFATINSPALVNPTANTPPQFDNSKALATSEFVKRMGLEYRDYTNYTATTTLTAADIGKVAAFGSAGSVTATLPTGGQISRGAVVKILCSMGAVTVKAAAGDSIDAINFVGNISMAQGDTAEFIRIDSLWRLMGGSVSLKYAAVMSGPNWITPAQFDNSKLLATSEFVQRALGNYAGVSSVNGGTVTLTASSFGKVISVNAATTVILPTGSTLVPGSTLFFFIYSGVRPTFVCQGADKISTPAGAGFYSSFTIKGTGMAELMWDGGGWALCGTAVLEESSAFGANLATNGYQKLPSGTIIQWGTQVLPASATTTFWFPLTFPNQCLSIVATFGTPAQGAVNADMVNASQYKLQNLYAGSQAARWIAIGN
ncbi:phage tail protein [Pseudomonas sp. Z2-11]